MIDVFLLFFLVVCAVAVVRMKDLLSAVLILSIYSLIMTLVWTRLNAVDVAFTEASVGAGITTVLLLAALSRTTREESSKRRPGMRYKGFMLRKLLPVLVVTVTGMVLVYGTFDMPNFSDPNAPAQVHVAPRYIEKSTEETGVINFVTAILASYRGYDTLGETAVIFTAGLCVIMLIRKKKKSSKPGKQGVV